MKLSTELCDPSRILTHASLYLCKHWRLYSLDAWEAAKSILRQAHDAVEQEDRIKFIGDLEAALEEQERQNLEEQEHQNEVTLVAA